MQGPRGKKVELVEHAEGATRLLVPAASLRQDPPPTSPVFFNPAASLNRDVSVAFAAGTNGQTFCDSMAGVGARGLRVANEVERVRKVVMVDFNAEALGAARSGAELNGVAGKCEFSDSETSSFLHSRFGRDERFDCVDLDPFGTPIRHLQAALEATADGGMLSITATDTAVLCGVYPRVSRRRYGAEPLKNHFAHETGVRLLAGAVAREGGHLDIGATPVFAHSTRHYLRLYMRVEHGPAAADGALGRLGFVSWCPHCGDTEVSAPSQKGCRRCGKGARVAGPLWVNGLTDPDLLGGASAAAEGRGLARAAGMIESSRGLDDFPPWSFSIEGTSSALKVPTIPESRLGSVLRDRGWRVMRTPFEKTGVKTDAPFHEFLAAAQEAAPAAGTSRQGAERR